jgi:hypothetical protein
MISRPSKQTEANIVWGIRHGLAFALILSVLAAIVYVGPGLPADAHNISILDIISFDFALGLIGGAMLGLLRRQAATAIGSSCIGFLIAAMGGGFVLLVSDKNLPGLVPKLLLMAIMGLVIGAPIGYVYHRMFTSDEPFL